MVLVEPAMSEKKPTVVRPVAARRLCPICGKPSYSSSGTHPQCSLARADAKARAARKLSGDANAKPTRKSWSKPCPKCKRQVPARRMVCDCGHAFDTAAPAAATAGKKLSGGPRKPR